MQNLASGVRVYPNPVTQGIISVEFKNMAAGIYKARLVNSVGQTMLFETITHAAGTSNEYIRPAFKLPAGIYQLEISEAAKSTLSLTVVVQ